MEPVVEDASSTGTLKTATKNANLTTTSLVIATVREDCLTNCQEQITYYPVANRRANKHLMMGHDRANAGEVETN